MEAALYLIPVTLGDTPHERVLPAWNREVVSEIRHFVVEEIRTARRFLRRVDREFPIDDCRFYEMGKHAEGQFSECLRPLVVCLAVNLACLVRTAIPAVTAIGSVKPHLEDIAILG